MEALFWRLPLEPAHRGHSRARGISHEHLDKGYMRGPKAMTFMYEGSARPE
jgi:hypothetical protein